MNHLAHLLLSEPDREAMVGNLMGDFVKGRVADAGLPGPVQRGIRLHRRIDRFADDHPVTRQSRRRLAPRYRRYGGILVDVFYDHFLALHWDRYVPVPLGVYVARVYRLLEESRPLMPVRMQRYVYYMREYDLLTGYGRMDGIQRALSGISRRLRHDNPVADAGGELERLRPALEADFLAFFPQLRAFVSQQVGVSPPGFGRFPGPRTPLEAGD